MTAPGGDLAARIGTAIDAADDAHLKSALTTLAEEAQRMADLATDADERSAIVQRLEALVREATATHPDHDALRDASEGLIDTGRTVGDRAAPIAKAVVAVLSTVGVVL